MSKEQLILTLFEIGAMKFGSYTLKSGMSSPIYIDLRLIVSYPELLKEIAHQMWEKIHPLEKDCLCGVPYTALPIATAISITHGIPMIMRRKEMKDYGTKRLIEGVFEAGERCVVLEDIITSGASIFETIAPLEQEGLQVKDVIVLIDREQGGRANLESKGYRVHSVFRLKDMARTLGDKQLIPPHILSEVLLFLECHSAAAKA